MADNCYTIQLYLDTALDYSDIDIQVDDEPVKFSIKGLVLELDATPQGFLHSLKLTSNTDKKFSINRVKIGDCDLRKLIYLSWMVDNAGKIFQPATQLWQAGQIWILPFGFPVSAWLELTEQKIPANLFGQDILSQYHVYFPSSLNLANSTFPQIIKDFFKLNYSFTIIDQSQIECMPYVHYNKQIPKSQFELVRQEMFDQHNYIQSNGSKYDQYQANLQEYNIESDKNHWKIVWLYKKHSATEHLHLFPQVQKLITDLKLDCWHAFVGLLPPGSFIYPHRDLNNLQKTTSEYRDYRGCTQLYIPIECSRGNYIKFAGAGTLDLNQTGPMVINNDYFTHAVINNS